jgi:hypothetical protein
MFRQVSNATCSLSKVSYFGNSLTVKYSNPKKAGRLLLAADSTDQEPRLTGRVKTKAVSFEAAFPLGERKPALSRSWQLTGYDEQLTGRPIFVQ